MPFQQAIYRMEDERLIRGVASPIFIHNWDYHLTTLKVYEDGVIDCWGQVDFDGFKEKVRTGWIVLQPPEGARVCAFPLGAFNAVQTIYDVEPEEFIKEVADVIAQLNSQPTSSALCREAWEAYNSRPAEETREKLRAAYEAVPKHVRRYLTDMDRKDRPIRTVLGLD